MARATAFLRRELKRNTPRRLRQAQRMRTDSFLVEFRRILVRSAFPRLRWRNISPSRKIIFGECEAASSFCFFLNFAGHAVCRKIPLSLTFSGRLRDDTR